MANESNDAFAQRMRERRTARAREARRNTGAYTAAWETNYRAAVAAFGKPIAEDIEGSRYVLIWAIDGETIRYDIGLVWTALQRPTRRLAIVEMGRRWRELIYAPRTAVSFVVAASGDEYQELESLEAWSNAHDTPPIRVINDAKIEDHVLLFIRSNGHTDWFGRNAATPRPAITINIP